MESSESAAVAPETVRSPKASGLGRIGLCLSGGGYRAAAFHLGALDLLQRAGLLSNVRVLSTISGGTFTGCAWALSLARGETFQMFYQRLHGFLEGTDCISSALDELSRRPATTPSGRRSLITAAAQVYARPEFMGDARFGTLLSANTQLEQFSFNATEFHTGVGFRFQKSRTGLAPIGNGNFSLTEGAAAQLRLADIVAASSCFPAGFEPIALPDDFVWPDGARPPAPLGNLPPGLALMDGGVFDNQGIDALLLADARARHAGEPLDLLFVSDVDQKSELAFFQFEREAAKGWLALPEILWFVRLTVLGALVSAVLLARDLRGANFSDVGVWFRLVLPMLVMLVVASAPVILYLWIRKKIRGRFSAKAEKLWHYLRRQKVSQAVELVELRGKSLVAMASKIFMKRIRSLQLAQLFADPRFRDRTVTSFIYELLQVAEAGPHLDYPDWLLPTNAQVACARMAHQVDTALWFDSPGDLLSLVASGQSTTCFNLLEFVERRLEQTPDDAVLVGLRARLRSLWERLKADPYRFASESSRPVNVVGSKPPA